MSSFKLADLMGQQQDPEVQKEIDRMLKERKEWVVKAVQGLMAQAQSPEAFDAAQDSLKGILQREPTPEEVSRANKEMFKIYISGHLRELELEFDNAKGRVLKALAGKNEGCLEMASEIINPLTWRRMSYDIFYGLLKEGKTEARLEDFPEGWQEDIVAVAIKRKHGGKNEPPEVTEWPSEVH